MQPKYKTWAEIDLAALRHNWHTVCDRVHAAAPAARVIAVVKANAYGHGVPLAVPALTAAGCGFFAVSCTSEAEEVRALAPSAELLILGCSVPDDAGTLYALDTAQTVFSLDYARALSSEMARLAAAGKIPADARLGVHLKLDTGMNRLGFDTADAAAAAAEIAGVYALPHLDVRGMFTHFACADEDRGGGMSAVQYGRFRAVADQLARRGLRPPMLHCCNSAASLTMPAAYEDGVRAGVILYGMMPDGVPSPDFRPVMTLKTRIAHIHTLRAGESVSYGATFTAERDMRIATLPIGYADGFVRRYTGSSAVLPDGRRAPIIGRICMDQCMIDLGASEVQPGDAVTLFGGDGGEALEAIARRAETINYEITSIITARVPRVAVNGENI